MITLLSQPQDFMPVNNPILWTWESDEVTQPNFKYVVDLFINGSLHSTHDVFIGEFDAKEALEAVVKSALTFTGNITEVFTDSIVKYRIRIKEFYSGSIFDTVFTDIKVGINGALRPPEWKDYTPELYVLQNDGLAVQRQFLTRFPSNQKRFIGINETAHLGVNIRKAINEIVFVGVWLYDADGSLIVSSPLSVSSFESILINVSPKVIIQNSTITLMNFQSAAYYEVRATLFSVAFPFILTPVGRTEDLRFYIDRDCERYPWIRLHWLNKLGGFDEFSFKLDTVHESDVTIFDKGYVHYTKSAIDRLILNSDWINETTQNWLVRELLESPLVYLEQLKVAEDIDCSCVRIVAVEGGNTVFYRPELQEDGSYLFGGFQLACNGGEWVVSNIVSETCDCVTVTITEGESVTVVTLNADGVDETGRSYYSATVDGVFYQLGWFETRWALIASEDEESVILGELFENGLCPFGNWRVSLEDVDSIVSEDCGESPSGDDCDCISVTYQLIGEEPVTVEVEGTESIYTIEGIGTIEKVGDEWQVTDGGTQMFVAVSTDGSDRVSISENGTDWILQDTDSLLLLSIVYGNGLFVAVGVNAVTTSDDGITWVNRAPAESNTWSSVVYGNGVFVAVSRNGTNRVMTSIDGITWVSRSASENNSWQGVVFADGLFVAVASDGTNRVMTSIDGITWANQTASQNNDWTSITYGNGLFIAVAQSGTNRVMTSPDGITWTNRTASENNQWMSVTYGNGLFVAVAQNGTNRVMTSSDGITWTSRSASEANQWRSITYGNGLFVAVADNGTNRVMKSTDGVTWTSSIIANNQWFGVTFGGAEIYATLSEDTFCPFGTFGIEEGSIFESFSVAPCPPTPTTYATLNEDCACPIGVYTNTEESPFTFFSVIPCDDPDYLIEYERIKVIDTTYQLRTRKRNGLFAQQVTAQRAYEYRSQLA